MKSRNEIEKRIWRPNAFKTQNKSISREILKTAIKVDARLISEEEMTKWNQEYKNNARLFSQNRITFENMKAQLEKDHLGKFVIFSKNNPTIFQTEKEANEFYDNVSEFEPSILAVRIGDPIPPPFECLVTS